MPELMELIEFLDENGDTIVKRIPEKGSGEFKFGSQLIVRESQNAIFFRDGKCLDVFPPGRHVLRTQNLPLITKFVTSLGYGENSPFKSEVYFINLKLFRNLKWGTKEPILFRDDEFKMVRLRGFGLFSITIIEPTLFLNKIVGTQNTFKESDILGYLKSIVIHKLQIVLSKSFKAVLDLPSNLDKISLLLKKEVLLDFDSLGIELNDFNIISLSLPPEVQKIIDTKTGMTAVGNLDDFMKFQLGKSILNLSENKSDSFENSFASGSGIGMGMLIPNFLNQSVKNNTEDKEEDIYSKLTKLKELFDKGIINEEEYTNSKRKILDNIK